MKLLVVVVLLGLVYTCTAGNGGEAARLLASKNILNQYLVEDRDLTVEYKIFNIGGR